MDGKERLGLGPEIGGSGLSRRGFLAGSAALFGGGAALVALPGLAKAHNPNGPLSDMDILNFALTLEHLEANFYIDGLKKFGDQLGTVMRRNFNLIRDHEIEHVDTLKKIIRSLGRTPVPRGNYNFERTAFTSKEKFFSVAQLLENTGVSAYSGAIAHLERGLLLTGGAQIATVEARHASYINFSVNGDSPFPDAFDQPVAPRDIFDAAAQFIDSLPEPYGPYRNANAFREKLPTQVIGGIPREGL